MNANHEYDLESALLKLAKTDSEPEDEGFTDRVMSRLPTGFSHDPGLSKHIALLTVTVTLVLLVLTLPVDTAFVQMGYALATTDITWPFALLVVTCGALLINEVGRIWR